MGLFGKDKKGAREDSVPTLPDLPKLPELYFPEENQSEISQLPTLPNNSFGNKFSQNTIKEAVTGKKEVNDGAADEFFDEDSDEERMMQPPLRKPTTQELEEEPWEETEEYAEPEEAPLKYKRTSTKRKDEPVFIRLDKFEDAMKIFAKAKNKISEIEKILQDTKRIKEEEEKELASWEQDMKSLKTQIEKIDSDVFSKIE